MSSYMEVPVYTPSRPYPPPPAPTTKHPRTRHYARRVKESLTTRLSKFLCSLFLGLLLISGLIAFILWISLRPHRPRFHVDAFSPASAALTFNVSIRNPNQNVGIYYDAMDATVYFREQSIGMIASLLSPFYQPHKNTTTLFGNLAGASLTATSDSWSKVAVNGTLDFRLELNSTIRFKVLTSWVSKRHRMNASCDVSVGSDGQILATSKGKRCSLYFY